MTPQNKKILASFYICLLAHDYDMYVTYRRRATASLLIKHLFFIAETAPNAYVVFANRNATYRVNLDETEFGALVKNSSLMSNTIAIDYDIRYVIRLCILCVISPVMTP